MKKGALERMLKNTETSIAARLLEHLKAHEADRLQHEQRIQALEARLDALEGNHAHHVDA